MFAALFFLLLSPQAASSKPAPAPPPATTPGASSTVHVGDGHISYAIPQGITAQPGLGDQAIKAEADKNTGVAKQAIGCVSVPLLGMEASENFRMVSILELDTKCLGVDATKQPLGDLAASTLGESLKRMAGAGQLSTPQMYKLGAQDAAVVRGTVASEKLGVTFQALAACTTSASKIVCWELIALSQEKVDALATQPAQIDNAAPVAVVPADVLKNLKVAAAAKP